MCAGSTFSPHIPPTLQSTNSLKSLSQFGYSSLYLKFTVSKINLRFLPKGGYQYHISMQVLRKILFYSSST